MDVAAKYRIVEKIIQSDDDAILNEISSILGIENDDIWFELSEEVKSAINESKEQLDRGEGIPHENVMNRVKARFLKP